MKEMILDMHDNAVDRRIQLSIMEFVAGRVDHRISWRELLTGRYKFYTYNARTTLPIGELYKILDQAFDDIEDLGDQQFYTKYTKLFDHLQWQYRIDKDKDPKIPSSWEEFVALAVEVHVQKNTDYESAFMQILLTEGVDSRSIWAWEVKKKLDRLRRWIKAGKIEVKGEGVLDSVIDLSNYTLQYELSSKDNPYLYLLENTFKTQYEYLGHEYIIRYLVNSEWAGLKLLDLSDDLDYKVHKLILKYMGVIE